MSDDRYFGEVSQQEIADRFQISKRRVQQLEARALRKPREGLADDPEIIEYLAAETRPLRA